MLLPMRRDRIIIVGAGLSGLSAALELASRGYMVTVFESREVVGGRTSNWMEGNMRVESGLHRFSGFYTALPKLLHAAGVEINDIVSWGDSVEIRLPAKRGNAVFGVAPLHHPLSFLYGMLDNNQFLTWREKVHLFRFFTIGVNDYERHPDWLDKFTVAAYALKLQLSYRLISKILVPLAQGTCFLPPDKCSTKVFFNMLVPCLKHLPNSRVGVLRGGMSELMCEPIVRRIETLGGSVRLAQPVDDLVYTDNKVMGVVVEGKEHLASATILAASLGQTKNLLRNISYVHPWFNRLMLLPTLSAVTVQLELRRPALTEDRLIFSAGTPLACLAEESRTAFPASKGRLSVILAPADKFLYLDDAYVFATVYAETRNIGIRLQDIIRDYRVVIHEDSFYSAGPNNDYLRPVQKTPVTGLFLAGDYTAQGYGATMEGAVISGKLAAREVEESLNEL